MIKHHIETGMTRLGARVAIIKNTGLPLESVSVWFPAGSVCDPVGKEGLAHFFEHLLMIKTNNYPTRMERLEKIEENGMYYNAYTQEESAHYYFVESPEKTNLGLELLVDGVNNSLILHDDIIKERSVVLNEEANDRNNPQSYIWRLTKKALWPDCQLGRDFYGDGKSVSSINLLDIKKFFEKYYFPANAYFVIVGEADLKETISRIDNSYDTDILAINSDQTETDQFHSPKKLLIDNRNLDTDTISVAYRTCSLSNSDWIALKLISNYLAGGWISRLVQRLRVDKDITYWVNSFSNNFYDAGYLSLVYSTSHEKVEESLKIILEEINHLKENTIPENILTKHKTAFKSQFLRFNSLDPGGIAYWYGQQAIYTGSFITMDKFLEEIDKIGPQDIKATAQKYFVEEGRSLAIIGGVDRIGLKTT